VVVRACMGIYEEAVWGALVCTSCRGEQEDASRGKERRETGGRQVRPSQARHRPHDEPDIRTIISQRKD
jgi:hypothetical protein